MKKRYKDVGEWIRDCRALVRADWDNLILFTGPEGVGKSTVAFQVMRALDEGFDVERTHFGIANFLAYAPTTPRGGAVLGDEIEANKRAAMTRLLRDLLDYFKDCRGLNHHMGICFPHEELLDSAILNHRVRWKVNVPERGRWVLYERVKREYRKRGGEVVTSWLWVERGSWRYAKNRGAMWDAYGKKKEHHMESLGGRYKQLLEAPPTGIHQGRMAATFAALLEGSGEWEDPGDVELSPVVRESSSGIDRAGAAKFFVALRRREDEKGAGSRASIDELP